MRRYSLLNRHATVTSLCGRLHFAKGAEIKCDSKRFALHCAWHFHRACVSARQVMRTFAKLTEN